MNSKLRLHLEKVLILESTSLELILEESLSKEVFLASFCEYNNYLWDKEVFTDYPETHKLIIKIYSYES